MPGVQESLHSASIVTGIFEEMIGERNSAAVFPSPYARLTSRWPEDSLAMPLMSPTHSMPAWPGSVSR